MDPTLILTFFLNNPQLASNVAGAAKQVTTEMTRPGQVDVAKMQQSLVDMSRGVLHCYHKSARFRLVDVMQTPWPRQAQYGAQASAVIRIQYTGVSGASYAMDVAVMAKEKAVRAAVIRDTALIRYNKNCALEEWTG
jgi:hypothetical protein